MSESSKEGGAQKQRRQPKTAITGRKRHCYAKKPNGKNATGVVEVTLDADQAKKLAEIGCTNEEISYALGCSKDTVERRCKSDPAFGLAMEQGRAKLKESVRRTLLRIAEKDGNASAAIFLAKAVCGMRDVMVLEGNSEKPIVLSVVDSLREREAKLRSLPNGID
jgi:hypothetical protein